MSITIQQQTNHAHVKKQSIGPLKKNKNIISSLDETNAVVLKGISYCKDGECKHYSCLVKRRDMHDTVQTYSLQKEVSSTPFILCKLLGIVRKCYLWNLWNSGRGSKTANRHSLS